MKVQKTQKEILAILGNNGSAVDGTSINKTMLGKIGIEGSINANIVVQDKPETIPAFGKACSDCGKAKHFIAVCSQHRKDRSKARSYQGVEDWCIRFSRMRRPFH